MGTIVLFTFGVVVGALLAGVAFGGAYVGFVLRAGRRRDPDRLFTRENWR